MKRRVFNPRQIVFPRVMTEFYPLRGGLDLETPAIELEPGKCFDALNYEPMVSGGYRRINGYERFDGTVSPTSASYWVMTIAQTGAISNGDTVTGVDSAANGRVLGVYGTTLVLGRVNPEFVVGETLQVSGVDVGTVASTAAQNGASSSSDNADYLLLAANDRRPDILAPSGSGRIRGIEVYGDSVYAFRDDGSEGHIYKHTAGGWGTVALGREITFDTGSAAIHDGDTVTGATSGATAIARRVLVRTGDWGSAAAGSIVFRTVTGAFQNGENLQVGGSTKAVAKSADTAIVRQTGGRVETIIANFTGSTATERMYGADGVNPAFEFDGTDYVPIHTGMTADTPTHIIEHRSRLFLSFYGSVQFSSVTSPYAWTAVLGAGEIATGSACTGFLMQTGSSTGASLLIFTKDRTFVLYGLAASDFTLVPSNRDLGYAAYTMQVVGNNSYGLTSRGIHAIVTTLDYGDFNFDSVSFPINSLMTAKLGLETASTTLKSKDQYRLFFSDGTGLIAGLAGDKMIGLMPVDYGRVVRCITTRKLSTGQEVTYFGSDDGFVYQDNVGTSFDGAPIDAAIRPAFNNLHSPRMRKRFRRATFEVKAEGYAQVNVTCDLGYANPAVSSSRVQAKSLTGNGGYWDQFQWDQFVWDTQIFADPSISIEGTEKNISLFFYSSRAQDAPHVVQGVVLSYSPRREERT